MASSSSQPNLKAEVESGGGANPVSVDGGGGGGATASDQVLIYKGGLKKAKKERGCTAKERISKMPPCAAGKRSSIYRGVTRHRWTGRYEAHLWDKSTWNQNQNKKGKQVYLGAYDDEEAAARAYDLAALKYWGPGTLINFPVSDYARDIEEMQNVSREDYLASLRRKSSGFSRGISKYRGLSSRWEQSIGRLAGHQYFNMDYGNETVTEGEYTGAFCIERKIDLTSYIKWWNTNKSHQEDIITKSSEETKHGCSEDVGSELKSLDWVVRPTEPYQMPQFGTFHERKKPKQSTVSALSILSQSAAYKSFQERVCRKLENNTENNENEIKSDVNRMDYGKAVEKGESLDVGSERPGVPLGMGGGLPLQRNIHPLNPFLSAPVLTKYSSMDPLTDPILWSSLVPGLPTDLSLTAEVTKREPNSNYTFFTQEE